MALSQSEFQLSELKAQLAQIQAGIDAKEAEVAGLRETSTVFPYSKRYNRTVIKDILKMPCGGKSLVGKTITVGGWVKTGRMADKNKLVFLELNDGSSPKNLQVLVSAEVYEIDALKATGTCVVVEGEIKESPESSTQSVELHATAVKDVGACDAKTFPIAKKKMTLEYLRSVSHLRSRTNTIAAISRIRNALSYATHTFFQSNGFNYIHTPIITCSDCEGAGEMFQVTTLLGKAEEAGPEVDSTQLVR